MKIVLRYSLLIWILLIAASCEYYLGINQQPDFTNNDIPEGLNICGVLRPDSAGGTNRSFVFVQRLWPVLVWGDFDIVTGVSVAVEHYRNDTLTDTTDFPLQLPDGYHADTLYRTTENFQPQPGDRYRLICRHPDFPEATGEAIFPPEPHIVDNSLSIDGRNVSFRITADTLIAMIDVYFVTPGSNLILARVATDENNDTEINIELPADPEGMQLYIFGYEKNMAVYLGNSNTSLNFNKYRTTISTLESGYGVFGALNYTVVEL